MHLADLWEARDWWEPAVSKKIIFVTNDFGPRAGGIETFVIGLIERRPFGSTIVYTSNQKDCEIYDAKWLNEYGVRVIRDRSKILLPTPRVALALSKLVKKESIDTVAFGAAAPLGLLSAWLKSAGVQRTVALTHGHEVWWAKVFPFNLLLRRIGSTVDVLSYLGEFTRTVISGALTSQAASAMVKIAPGIDVEHFSPRDAQQLRTELGLADKRVLVSVGRLVHRKGQDRLVQALPSILAKVPNAHLLLVGEGPHRKHLEELIQTLKLENHTTLIGRIQYAELPLYLCAGDVFVMPSRSRFFGLEVEGLGIVYLEASACGLPVIAGNSGGAPDAVIESQTGFVVDGTDIQEIANASVALLNDPALCTALGSAGREWIVEKWRWEIWSQQFETLLSK